MKWMLLLPLLLAGQDDPAAFEKRMGTVEARPADAAPKIDGVADDKAWASAKEHTLAVDIPEEILDPKQSATLKVLHHGGEIFFLLRWKDKTESIHHKPWVWNADRKQYVASEELEDVAFIARGPHLEAMRNNGLRVLSHFGDFDLPR